MKHWRTNMLTVTMKLFVYQNFLIMYNLTKQNEVDEFQNLFLRVKGIIYFISIVNLSCFFLTEKDLLQEWQKCRCTTKAPTPTEKLSIPALLDIHLKNLEEERDRYRRELNKNKRLSRDKVNFIINKSFCW